MITNHTHTHTLTHTHSHRLSCPYGQTSVKVKDLIKQRDENQQVNVEIEEDDTKEGNSSSMMEVDKPVLISDSETTSKKEEESEAKKLKQPQLGNKMGEKSSPIDLTGGSSVTPNLPRTATPSQQDKEKESGAGSKTRVRRESLTLMPKPQQQEKEKDTPYSDISDASDIDEGPGGVLGPSSSIIPPTKDGEKLNTGAGGLPMQQQNSFQSTRGALSSMNGFMPMSTLNSGKDQKPPSQEMFGQLARLPSFNSIDQLPLKSQSTGEELGKESSGSSTQSSSKEQLRKQRSDEYVSDSQPISPQNAMETSSSANSMRPSLMSSGTTSASSHGASVSVPGQNQRHGMANQNSSPFSASAGTVAGHRPSGQKSSLNSDNPLHSTGISSMDHSGGDSGNKGNVVGHSLPNNKRGGGISSSKSHSSSSKATNYSMVALYQHNDGRSKGNSDHRRSVSPRPRSLTPSKSTKQQGGPHRSPSPATATTTLPSNNKQQISDQGAKLPSFDSPPVPGINIPPVPPQGATIAWGAAHVTHSKGGDEDRDSDSSGSGGIISTHRRSPKRSKKRRGAEPLSGLKPSEQQSRDTGDHSAFSIGNMQNVKQPETPALGPIPNFSLGNFQPISPGVVETLPGHHIQQQQQQQQQQQHLKDVASSGGAASVQKQLPSKGFGPVPPTATPQGGMAHHLSAVDGNKKSIQHRVPSPTPSDQRTSKQIVTVGEMMQNIGSSAASGLHSSPMLPSISGGGPGKPVERDQEIRGEAPRRKSDEAVLVGKVPDQQPQQPGPPFIQFSSAHQGVIAAPGGPPQHVIQMTEMTRDRSNHLSRGGSAFQATIESSGNGHPREHRKRPGAELHLESSKRSPPSDGNLRPPPASLRLPSKGIPTTMQQFMSPFMDSDEAAKDSKLKEQFPPGFDYDPNLPCP